MALTTAQQVRLRIQDQPRVFDDTYYGDGTGSAFNLPQTNLTSASAFIMQSGGVPATGWSATGATFDASGFVTFSAVLSADSAFRVRGVHSVFSDDEIGHFTAIGGNINGAALEAVQALMFDGLKRAAWAAPDGSEYDDTRAMGLLNDLYKTLKQEQGDEAIAAGGFNQWALTQTAL